MDGTTFWGRFAAPLPRRSLARTTGKNPGRSPGDGLAKSPVVGKPRQIESKKDYAVQHSIVFLDRSTVEANLRAADFPHSYKEYAVTSTNEIVDRLRDATIAIINKVPMREATLAKLPSLKLIAVAATGTDVVDKTYCN